MTQIDLYLSYDISEFDDNNFDDDPTFENDDDQSFLFDNE